MSDRKRTVVLVLCLLGLYRDGLLAQDDLSEAVAAARSALVAEDSGNITEFVGFVAPEGKLMFKRAMLRIILAEETGFDGRLPPPKERRSILRTVFHLNSIEQFEALAPGEALTRWLVYTELPHSAAGQGASHFGYKRTIIGGVREGDGTIDVVFRMEPVSDSLAKLTGPGHLGILRIELTAYGWRLLLEGGLDIDATASFGFSFDSMVETEPKTQWH